MLCGSGVSSLSRQLAAYLKPINTSNAEATFVQSTRMQISSKSI